MILNSTEQGFSTLSLNFWGWALTSLLKGEVLYILSRSVAYLASTY